MGKYEDLVKDARDDFWKGIVRLKPGGVFEATLNERSVRSLARAMDDAGKDGAEAMAKAHMAFNDGSRAHLAKLKERGKSAAGDLAKAITDGHARYERALKQIFSSYLREASERKRDLDAGVEAYTADRERMVQDLRRWRDDAAARLRKLDKLVADAAEAKKDSAVPGNQALVEDLARECGRMALRAKNVAGAVQSRWDNFCKGSYQRHRQEGAYLKHFGLRVEDVRDHVRRTWREMEELRSSTDRTVRSLADRSSEVATLATQVEALGLSRDKRVAKYAAAAKAAADKAAREHNSIKSFMALSPSNDPDKTLKKVKEDWDKYPDKRAAQAAANSARLTKLAQTTSNVGEALKRIEAEVARVESLIDEDYRKAEGIEDALAAMHRERDAAKALVAKHDKAEPALTDGLEPYTKA